MSKQIIPMDDNVIVKIVPQDTKIGMIVIPGSAVEQSTLAEVVVPNSVSYFRDGTQRRPILKKGMRVRIPKGKAGTSVPESPDNEDWLAIPEDLIYYIIGEDQ